MSKNTMKYKNVSDKILFDEFIKDSQLIKYKSNIIKEFKLNDKQYISKNESVKILQKYKSSVSDELVDNLNENNDSMIDLNKHESLKDNAIDLANNIFAYADKQFTIVQVNDDIYFKGKDIAEFLEYTNTKEAIIDHVDDDEKFKLTDIFRGSNSLPLTYNEKNTIYITESGLYSLILSSKKKEAKAFKKFITKELLPTLRKKGTYSLVQKVILDTSFITCFYDENDIHEYIDCNVVYLGIIGLFDGGYLIKYGKSYRIYDRDFNEHKNTFGEQFKLVLIVKTDNYDKVEKLFEQTIKSKGLNRKLQFNGKMRDELFVTTDDFTAEKAKNLMIQIANDNPTKEIKEKDDKIKELEFYNEKTINIEKEKTKRAEIELKKAEEITKQKEFEFKKEVEITKQIELKIKPDITNIDINDNPYTEYQDNFISKDEDSIIRWTDLKSDYTDWFKENVSMNVPKAKDIKFYFENKVFKEKEKVVLSPDLKTYRGWKGWKNSNFDD